MSWVTIRSDVEFRAGTRLCRVPVQTSKAADTLGIIYYTMPASAEADAAYAELKKTAVRASAHRHST